MALPKRKVFKRSKPVTYVVNDNGCFICTSHAIASKRDDRYFFIRNGDKRWVLHRFVYYNYKGEIPEGMVIMHTCDNPKCINPRHLEVGTQGDNVRDASRKGRLKGLNTGRGENARFHKLSEKQVFEIREQRHVKRQTLGDMYGVSPHTIDGIRSGRAWSHLFKK